MRDWHINAHGEIEAGADAEEFELPPEEYRLYRFLTELEDLLRDNPDDDQLVKQVSPMVRRLLTSSYWLQASYSEPDPKKGWSVDMLYDEPEFPLTVQMVAWQPGTVSPIHNHGAWGIVAFVMGSEKNVLWRETVSGELEQVGERVFEAGDIVTFVPETIHHIEAIGEDTVVSFNIYGKTDYKNRYEFDPKTADKKLF
ncbi:cupin [[Limnothrix rosea] IAM M-220]|uniref:cysteine dioxygenase family protein n=1 Tax=[Limnothrix rosea] IAM M-220 TaxID=454133 RepID=UPI000966ED37|nr:cupin [[Limnothrix rosea] IAM M-220]OKH18481.1 cupin [[Limnothrix rosea] IAM M-220]